MRSYMDRARDLCWYHLIEGLDMERKMAGEYLGMLRWSEDEQGKLIDTLKAQAFDVSNSHGYEECKSFVLSADGISVLAEIVSYNTVSSYELSRLLAAEDWINLDAAYLGYTIPHAVTDMMEKYTKVSERISNFEQALNDFSHDLIDEGWHEDKYTKRRADELGVRLIQHLRNYGFVPEEE